MIAIFHGEGFLVGVLVLGTLLILAVAIMLDKLTSFLWRKLRKKNNVRN